MESNYQKTADKWLHLGYFALGLAGIYCVAGNFEGQSFHDTAKYNIHVFNS